MGAELGRPAWVGEALGMLDRAPDHLTAADGASLSAAVQAQALRAMERAESKHTAARAERMADPARKPGAGLITV
jgi:hypothetical protein